MEEITKDQWKEFHYGSKPKRKRIEYWNLFYGDVKICTGSYALCVDKAKQYGGHRKNANLKIKPNT
jgi:hypothetical protein